MDSSQVTFTPFSPLHGLVLALIALASGLLIVAGRRSNSDSRARLERAVGWFALAVWAVSNGWWMLPPRFDPARSLPLQLCDFTALLAALVLLAPRRSFSALLYFWGFAMSLQALLTPDIGFGPHSLWFWMFWVMHGGILAVALYDILVRRYRPAWRDYRLAVIAGLGYLAAALTINVLFDYNYGFVGNARPGQRSVMDFLGPWPQRVAVIAVLVIGVMTLLMLPWHRRRPRPASPGRNAS